MIKLTANIDMGIDDLIDALEMTYGVDNVQICYECDNPIINLINREDMTVENMKKHECVLLEWSSGIHSGKDKRKEN